MQGDYYAYEDQDGGDILVERKCPNCSRYISYKGGKVFQSGLDSSVTFKDWTCTKCGPITPHHEFVGET